jgi:hypothetical protein
MGRGQGPQCDEKRVLLIGRAPPAVVVRWACYSGSAVLAYGNLKVDAAEEVLLVFHTAFSFAEGEWWGSEHVDSSIGVAKVVLVVLYTEKRGCGMR